MYWEIPLASFTAVQDRLVGERRTSAGDPRVPQGDNPEGAGGGFVSAGGTVVVITRGGVVVVITRGGTVVVAGTYRVGVIVYVIVIVGVGVDVEVGVGVGVSRTTMMLTVSSSLELSLYCT